MEKKLTPMQTVKAKCMDCCGDVKGGKQTCKDCTMTECALYHHKAGKKDGKQTMTATRAMKEYCKQCCNGDRKEPKLCTAVNCPIYIFNKQKEAERAERRAQKEVENA